MEGCPLDRRQPDLPPKPSQDRQNSFWIGVLRRNSLCHVKLQATIDHALHANIITRTAMEIAGREINPEDQSCSRIICGTAGTQYRPEGLIKIRYFLPESPKSYEGTFYVVDDAPCDLILGVPLDILRVSPRNDNDVWLIGLRPLAKGTQAVCFPFSFSSFPVPGL